MLMENFLWTYCLNEEQFTKLYRIICKVPGLLQYLKDHNDRELTSHILNFQMLSVAEGTSSPGMRINLDILIDRYDLFRKEYEEKNRKKDEVSHDFDLYHVLTWSPKPRWTNSMIVEEIDYLDHFIALAPQLTLARNAADDGGGDAEATPASLSASTAFLLEKLRIPHMLLKCTYL